jgi:hypothetical protein
MEIKVLEIRDSMTFLPVICIRPVPDNEGQRYLLRRDGYRGGEEEHCIVMIDAQCRGVAYDPYDWSHDTRTKPYAHKYIEEHWHELKDGDVVDVEFILGETASPKVSERNLFAAD